MTKLERATEYGHEVLRLSDGARLVRDTGHRVYLEYVERATDHWSSDTETCVLLDRDEVREVIAWLQEGDQ